MNYYKMFNIRLVNPRNTENIYRCIYENQTEINDFLNKGCKILDIRRNRITKTRIGNKSTLKMIGYDFL